VTVPGLLEDARREVGLSVPQLWMAYFALGGTKSATELGDYLVMGDVDAGSPTSDADHDALVHALNETLLDRGAEPSVPYRAG
jgi:hypothetical protein